MDTTQLRRVESAGVSIAVREHSRWAPGRPSVILVHGYPDQQQVWDPLIGFLPHDDFHIVTYDVRGAGASGVPGRRSGYRTELLVEDLVAVVEATVPDHGRFHLVGHDWGSVQLWDVVHAEAGDARLRGRIASFTSISGPSLDHLAYLARNPAGRQARLLQQAAHSWYVGAFQVPVVPELFWRFGHRLVAGLAARTGGDAAHWGPELGRNAVNGLGLYRANLATGVRRPEARRTDVPVLVIRPLHDRFIAEVAYEELEIACSDVSVVDLDAGHWGIRTHAEQVAALVSAHVRAQGGTAA